MTEASGACGEAVVADYCHSSGFGDGRPKLDTTAPQPSRVYNYWLGGKDNFEADRQAARWTVAGSADGMRRARRATRANRAFLARAVRYLAGDAGIRQFLDIGTGLPAGDNTHEVAQRKAPQSRVVYVDNDPVVLAHARALLTSVPEGATDHVDADLREPEIIVQRARATLDFGKPVAILLLAILQFVPHDEQAYPIVTRLLEMVPVGSYLVISHPTGDFRPDDAAEFQRRYNQSVPAKLKFRSNADVSGFFRGLDLIEPGVVPVDQWRPSIHEVGSGRRATPVYGGVGRKR